MHNIPNKTKKKKETHHYNFPFKTSFSYENVSCHEIFISEQIVLKIKCDVDEYLFFPVYAQKYQGEWLMSFGSV